MAECFPLIVLLEVMRKVFPSWSSCKAVRTHLVECAPPFVVIGFIVGILHHVFATTELPTFLSPLTNGAFSIRKDLLDVLSEHAAPKTLAYGMFAVIALVSLGRVLFGSASSYAARFSDRLVLPLYRFNLTLAAAMASLIVGLALSALLIGYFLDAFAFLVYALFSAMYIAVLSASVRLTFPLSRGAPNFDDDPVVSRLIGVLVLFIFVVLILIWPHIEWFLLWVLGVIKHGL